MRKLSFLFALAALLLTAGCCCGAKTASAKQLIITPKSEYQIVLPDIPDRMGRLNHLTVGAKMLQQALKEGLGIDAAIRKEATRQSGIKSIFIGDTKAVRALGIDPDKYKNFAFIIAEQDGNIFIAGKDSMRYGEPDRKNGGDWNYILGSLNGCVKFAERYLKTRFLYPGDDGVDYAKNLKSVTLPAGMRCETFPQLIFSCRSRQLLYNYSNNDYGYGAFKSYGGHSYYDACPAKVYGKTHPEYFIYAGGKRNPSGNHLCISNPEVQELIYKEMLKWLDKGAETVQLAQTDGFQPCQCEKCKALFGVEEFSEKIWILHRNLALRLLKERPGKNAHIICYPPNYNPPKTFKEFPPNVIIELCKYTPETFEAWKDYKVPGGFTTYIYNWGWYNKTGFLPKRTPAFCANQIRLFVKNNVRGIYRCGFGENFGLEGPSYYIYGQLLNDINQDEKVLEDDFYRRAFHECYAPMKDFFTTLYQRLELYSVLQNKNGKFSALPENPRVLITAILSPDVLDVLSKNLARAEKMAKDPKVKSRLVLVRTEFNYAKNLAETLHLYNAYRLNPNWTNFNQLAAKVEERNALINSYFKKGRIQPYSKRWWNLPILGSPGKAALLENGRLAAPIGAPLNWNTKFLKAKKVLPGVGKKSMKVYPASGNVNTFDFNRGSWAKAPWYELNGIQLAPVREKSRFKALYDAKNIYFAFESEVPASRQYSATGRDGSCCGQDCLEVMIDPTNTREVYYHLAWNPIENSAYDAAFGFIKDVLHPLYNQPDESWNGKWSYTTKRKGDKWYSVLTIPYTTIKAAKPGPGTVWLGNFGRETYFKPQTGPELLLWSPNLEVMSFHDKDTFGELLFQ